MSRIGSFLVRTILLVIICGLVSVAAAAQLTIFNIPTTDTLPHGALFFEGDLIIKPVANDLGGYQTYGYRVVYGLTNKTDVGANLYLTHSVDGTAGELQISAKRKLYDNESLGLAISAGTIGFFPLRNTTSARAGVMLYANVSKKVEPLNGLRVTSGVYTILGGGDDFGTKTGVSFGVEQPITKRVSFLADWYSGKNKFGYAAGGLNYTISSKQWILGGYNFGNSGRGNNALSVYYGYTF